MKGIEWFESVKSAYVYGTTQSSLAATGVSVPSVPPVPSTTSDCGSGGPPAVPAVRPPAFAP